MALTRRTAAFTLAIVLALAGSGGRALAKDVELYERRDGKIEFKKDFSKLITQLVEGEGEDNVVRFLDGKSYRLGKYLGGGTQTVVFELADHPGLAIRIPNSRVNMRHLEMTIDGYSMLVDHGVPLTHIEPSRTGEYILVERLPPKEKLWLFPDYREGKMPLAEKKQMTEALLDFARKVAPFNVIGDLNSSQLAYDRDQKKWILLDWANDHSLGFYERYGGKIAYYPRSPFDDLFFRAYFDWKKLRDNPGVRKRNEHLPPDIAALRTRLRETVLEERERLAPLLKVVNGEFLFPGQSCGSRFKSLLR